MKCRFCSEPVSRTFIDLGMQPLSNAYVEVESAESMEPFYPLHARVCERCLLVQLPEFAAPQTIFGDYAYLSSMSASWLDHCRAFAESAVRRLQLGSQSLVVEIASNDGYLLKFFRAAGIPVLGVEPAANVAEIARRAGVDTLSRFFGVALAEELRAQKLAPDLIVCNNVLAHVPNLNDFVAGLKILLAPGGTISIEFPHVARLIEHVQFDTIYHEHFSYFSLGTASRVLAAHGLVVFDVEELPTHGGSLRLHARHAEREALPVDPRVGALLERERAEGLATVEGYSAFSERVHEVKRKLLDFLIVERRARHSVVAYGAAAKGNTLLNYAGVRTDFIDYAVDKSQFKQGKLLPGTRIPIHAPERIGETKPDVILILPWNLKSEIVEQMAYAREWGARFAVPIPELSIVP